MKKSLRNFLIAVGVGIVFFVISLIIQYHLPVIPIIRAIIPFAILSGIIGLFSTIGIIYIEPENQRKFSIDFFVLKFLMACFAFSIMLTISTSGMEIFQIFFFVFLVLLFLWTVYISFKELIKEYKKYKK